MSNLEKAAYKALEALNRSKLMDGNHFYCYEAANALRQALEPKPCDMGQMCLDCQPRGANGECPDQQPKQEPVAWCVIENGRIKGLCKSRPAVMNADKWQPLYTEPPKREWVGLTDEDEEHCQNEAAVKYRRYKSSIRGQMIAPADNYEWHLIRAVEAKLREKNT